VGSYVSSFGSSQRAMASCSSLLCWQELSAVLLGLSKPANQESSASLNRRRPACYERRKQQFVTLRVLGFKKFLVCICTGLTSPPYETHVDPLSVFLGYTTTIPAKGFRLIVIARGSGSRSTNGLTK